MKTSKLSLGNAINEAVNNSVNSFNSRATINPLILRNSNEISQCSLYVGCNEPRAYDQSASRFEVQMFFMHFSHVLITQVVDERDSVLFFGFSFRQAYKAFAEEGFASLHEYEWVGKERTGFMLNPSGCPVAEKQPKIVVENSDENILSIYNQVACPVGFEKMMGDKILEVSNKLTPSFLEIC